MYTKQQNQNRSLHYFSLYLFVFAFSIIKMEKCKIIGVSGEGVLGKKKLPSTFQKQW